VTPWKVEPHVLRLSFAFVLALALTGARTARAGSSPLPQVRLIWVRGEGTDGCSDGASIASRVSQRLGRSVFSDFALIRIEGVIEREDGQWRAHLYMRGADGRLEGVRHLTSDAPDCEALDAAATLAVALAIDPESALRPPPTPTAPAPSSRSAADSAQAVAPVVVVAPPPPAVLKEQPRREDVDLSVDALASFGLLPKTSVGMSLSAGVEVARFTEVTVGALYLPEVHTPNGDFAFGLTAGWAGACFLPVEAPRARLSLCGMGLLGAIHSIVLAFEPTNPGDRIWAAVALSARVRVRVVGPLSVDVGGDAIAPLTRDDFSVMNGPNKVFQEGSTAGTVFAGLGVEIP
jgi:hypothetical protein